jgi:hypothetical protein
MEARAWDGLSCKVFSGDGGGPVLRHVDGLRFEGCQTTIATMDARPASAFVDMTARTGTPQELAAPVHDAAAGVPLAWAGRRSSPAPASWSSHPMR